MFHLLPRSVPLAPSHDLLGFRPVSIIRRKVEQYKRKKLTLLRLPNSHLGSSHVLRQVGRGSGGPVGEPENESEILLVNDSITNHSK